MGENDLKYSPLKLLGLLEKTLMEWSLGGPLSELCPDDPARQPRQPTSTDIVLT